MGNVLLKRLTRKPDRACAPHPRKKRDPQRFGGVGKREEQLESANMRTGGTTKWPEGIKEDRCANYEDVKSKR